MKTTVHRLSFYRRGLAAICLITCLVAGPVTLADESHSKSADDPVASLVQEQALAKVAAFQAWTDAYAQADDSAKAALAAEGLTLAQQRRTAMVDLIKANPAAALAMAVPAAVRSQLPDGLAAQLETRVSGMGNLSVLIFCPDANGGPVPPMQRWVELNGQTYQAHVFGRRAAQTTKFNIPLQGIVLDGVVALDENPLRPLEAGESATGVKDALGFDDYTSSAPVIAEVGGALYRFATPQHLQKTRAELETAETGHGPNPVKSASQILETGPQAAPPTPWTTGEKRVLIIRVDFSDLPGDPAYPGIVGTAPYVQGVADNEVAPFYVTSSYGLTSLSNVVTTQLYRMPETAESYATANDNFGLHADARTLAAADYDLAEYDRICVLFSFLGNLPGSFINYGGLAQLGGPFLWVNGEFDFRVYSHELGHTYGLWHAGLWQVSDGNPISATGVVIEYGDDFDTMGANFANDFRTDFNPYYKNQLGWLSDSQVLTANADPATYRIFTFDSTNYVDAPSAPSLALRIVKDSEKSYWIGLRDNWEDNPFMQNGAYVIWGFEQPGAGGGGGYMSALLDMNPISTTLLDSPLTVRTLTDPDIGITIRRGLQGGLRPNRFMDVEINGGAPLTPTPRLLVATNFIAGGNGNGVIDLNECNDLFLVLTNIGTADATHVQVTLSTTNTGVMFGTRNSPYPDLDVRQSGTNLVPFTMSTAPFFVCGTPIALDVQVKSDQITTTNTLILFTGTPGTPRRFDSTRAVAIPDNSPFGTNSIITVTNITSAINKVTVSLYLTHTFDADLFLELISPDGTRVVLSDHNGGSGNNYGASCSPEIFRTTFDDAAFSSITAGAPPFVGSFRPEEFLSTFIGRFGTNVVNGNWRLRVVDDVGLDVGVLQCWSLFITAAECEDGGGTCPGADLAIGMTDAPDPVFIGSNLVYSISVTNFGPSAATNVVVNQSLPGSVIFASGTASQGNVSFAGGTVVGNLGIIPINGVATMTVTVIPTQTGIIGSTANVNSNDPDPDSSNNSATVLTQVQPPSADLAVGLLDAPDPALVDGLLTYTVSVTNNGPSVASGVLVTNTLPLSVAVQSASSSQGTAIISANVVVFSFGTLTNGGSATATINVTPTAPGLIVATATAHSNQVDSNTGNNTATATTTVGPSANLALTLTDLPDPVVVQSNWTYTITVTNQGPNLANGVQINQSLPPGVNLVSAVASQGTVSVVGTELTANAGSLPVGGGLIVTVVVNADNAGVYVSSATVSSTEADPQPGNNSANVNTRLAVPFVSIEAAGATLTAESFAPADGGIGVGETVTVQLRLRNAGNMSNTNLTATLLATGGVTSPSPAGPVNYGVLPTTGLPVSRAFAFTANGANGGTVTATLQLQDNGVPLGTATYVFTLPTVYTFANTNAITIPDSGSATPYPSAITVSGVAGLVGKITATLVDLNHTFPQDVDVLLVGPSSENTLLMSGAGSASVSGVNVTFDDGAASPVPQNGSVSSSSYRPAAYATSASLPPPAPVSPYPATLSVFNGLDANGEWSLYVVDRNPGDAGNIAAGWSLAVSVISPVNQITDLALNGVATPSPAALGDDVTCVFTITNSGPDAATGVAFTNVVPVGATLLSATSSQGSILANGNTVVGSLGSISAGSAASVTVVVRPVNAGSLVLPASVVSSEIDLNPANNAVSVNTTVTAPVADVSVGLTAASSVVLGSNLTFTVSVTNHGPQQALNVVVSDPLPAGLNFVSTSAGSFNNSGGTIQVNVGDLTVGEVATFTLVGSPASLGTQTNVVSVSTASSDSNPANNTASVVYTVTAPVPNVVIASALLTAENMSPANFTVDAGETVTIAFALQNVGSANTANLVATLQTSGGVTAPSGPQNYGALVAGGAAVSRSFSFTAAGAGGGVVVATLQLQSGTSNLGTVTYSFIQPATTSFTNAARITIPSQGAASPYPSTINVSGLTGLVTKATVRLNGLTHAFPDDVDVLLVSPSGQKVVLMSDAGGGHAVTNLTLNFEDGGAALPNANTLVAGNYAPTDHEPGDVFPSPAPAGTPGTTLATFKGGSPNGGWSLFVVDDSTGDGGNIAGGWTLTLTTVNPVNSVSDLAITMTDSPDSVYSGSILTYTIGVFNHGPAEATGVAVVSTLPAGVNFVSAAPSQGSSSIAGQTVTGHLGSLAVGAGATMSIQVTPTTGGSIINTASLSSGQSDLNLLNNSAQTTTTVVVPTAARLTSVVITNRQLQFTLTGEPFLNYTIQASTNLTVWENIGSVTASGNGTIQFTDPNPPTSGQRFYRAARPAP